MKKPLALAAALVAASTTISARATAGELSLELGPTVRKSSWRGDWAAGGQLGMGYRFKGWLSVDFVGWEELARVDRRANTGLSLGATAYLRLEKVRPFVRLFAVHQHEEGLVSVKAHPFDTVIGIGPGIRHRAGVGTFLGAELPLRKSGAVEWFAAGAATVTWFPDTSLGPGTYVGAFGTLGLHYDVPGLP